MNFSLIFSATNVIWFPRELAHFLNHIDILANSAKYIWTPGLVTAVSIQNLLGFPHGLTNTAPQRANGRDCQSVHNKETAKTGNNFRRTLSITTAANLAFCFVKLSQKLAFLRGRSIESGFVVDRGNRGFRKSVSAQQNANSVVFHKMS